MKSKHLLMALLAGGLAFGSCTSTPHVPEGKYLIAGMLKMYPTALLSVYIKAMGNCSNRYRQTLSSMGNSLFRIRSVALLPNS